MSTLDQIRQQRSSNNRTSMLSAIRDSRGISREESSKRTLDRIQQRKQQREEQERQERRAAAHELAAQQRADAEKYGKRAERLDIRNIENTAKEIGNEARQVTTDTFSSSVLGGFGASSGAVRSTGQTLEQGRLPKSISRTAFAPIDPLGIYGKMLDKSVQNPIAQRMLRKAGGAIEEKAGKSEEYFDEASGVIQQGIDQKYIGFRGDDGKLSLKKLANPMNWAQATSSVAGSMAPAAIVGLITKSPVAFGATMGLQEKGDAVKTWAQELANQKGIAVEDLSDEDIYEMDYKGDIYMFGSAILETIVPAAILKSIKGGKKVAVEGFKEYIFNASKTVLKRSAQESGTEYFQRILQNGLGITTGTKELNLENISEGALDEALAALPLGIIGGGGEAMATQKTNQRSQTESKSRQESFEGTEKQYEGSEIVKAGVLNQKIVDGRIQDMSLKLEKDVGAARAEQFRRQMEGEYASYEELTQKSKDVLTEMQKYEPRIDMGIVKETEEIKKEDDELIEAKKYVKETKSGATKLRETESENLSIMANYVETFKSGEKNPNAMREGLKLARETGMPETGNALAYEFEKIVNEQQRITKEEQSKKLMESETRKGDIEQEAGKLSERARSIREEIRDVAKKNSVVIPTKKLELGKSEDFDVASRDILTDKEAMTNVPPFAVKTKRGTYVINDGNHRVGKQMKTGLDRIRVVTSKSAYLKLLNLEKQARGFEKPKKVKKAKSAKSAESAGSRTRYIKNKKTGKFEGSEKFRIKKKTKKKIKKSNIAKAKTEGKNFDDFVESQGTKKAPYTGITVDEYIKKFGVKGDSQQRFLNSGKNIDKQIEGLSNPKNVIAKGENKLYEIFITKHKGGLLNKPIVFVKDKTTGKIASEMFWQGQRESAFNITEGAWKKLSTIKKAELEIQFKLDNFYQKKGKIDSLLKDDDFNRSLYRRTLPKSQLKKLWDEGDNVKLVDDIAKAKAKGKSFDGKIIAKEAKELGSDQGGLSDFTLDQIKKENYVIEKLSIEKLRKLDPDLDEYLSKSKKIREFEGEDFGMDPIVTSKGEVLDGYNRIAQNIKDGNSSITILRGKIKSQKFRIKSDVKKKAEALEEYKGENDVTIKTLRQLEGKKKISKQFIEDFIKRGDITKAEKDIVAKALKDYDQKKIPVKEFAEKVKADLLPLKREDLPIDVQKYEDVSLPDDLKGNVAYYKENIYESPIRTSAGDIHFNDFELDNYFAHSRIEDMAGRIDKREVEKLNKLFDYPRHRREIIQQTKSGLGGIRRVIEIQSDLFQKGRLAGQSDGQRFKYNDITYELSSGDKGITLFKGDEQVSTTPELQKEIDKVLLKYEPLNPYRNTWHKRIIKEEIKQASKDGKKKLQFPTGETAMKIEGLGDSAAFALQDTNGEYHLDLSPDNMNVGQTIANLQPGFDGTMEPDVSWIITEVLGDGKFKAAPKNVLNITKVEKGKLFTEDVDSPVGWTEVTNEIYSEIEQFDISGKIDTSNPIYKFYEKDVKKELKKYGGKKVIDERGVKWTEIKIDPYMKDDPVEAFRLKDDLAKKGVKISDTQEKKIKELNKKLFGDEDIKIVGQIIANKDALGSHRAGMIKILKGQTGATDTFYHEAVHKYLDVFTTVDEHAQLLVDAKKKFGVDTFGEAEEMLAEDFIKYAQKTEKFTGKLKAHYDKIKARIEKYFGNEDRINKLYAEISTGKAKKTKQKVAKRTKSDVGQVIKTPSKVIKKEPEIKTSKLGIGVRRKATRAKLIYGFDRRFRDLPEYETVNMKEQGQLATNEVLSDYDNAIKVAMGKKAPKKGILPESMFVAVEEHAIETKDIGTLQDLAKSELVSEATEMGQRIRTLAERNAESPVRHIQDVVEGRKQQYKKKNKKNADEAVRQEVKKIKKSIKSSQGKTTTKAGWNNFISEITC